MYRLEDGKDKRKALEAANATLTVNNAIMVPKAAQKAAWMQKLRNRSLPTQGAWIEMIVNVSK